MSKKIAAVLVAVAALVGLYLAFQKRQVKQENRNQILEKARQAKAEKALFKTLENEEPKTTESVEIQEK